MGRGSGSAAVLRALRLFVAHEELYPAPPDISAVSFISGMGRSDAGRCLPRVPVGRGELGSCSAAAGERKRCCSAQPCRHGGVTALAGWQGGGCCGCPQVRWALCREVPEMLPMLQRSGAPLLGFDRCSAPGLLPWLCPAGTEQSRAQAAVTVLRCFLESLAVWLHTRPLRHPRLQRGLGCCTDRARQLLPLPGEHFPLGRGGLP